MFLWLFRVKINVSLHAYLCMYKYIPIHPYFQDLPNKYALRPNEYFYENIFETTHWKCFKAVQVLRNAANKRLFFLFVYRPRKSCSIMFKLTGKKLRQSTNLRTANFLLLTLPTKSLNKPVAGTSTTTADGQNPILANQKCLKKNTEQHSNSENLTGFYLENIRILLAFFVTYDT